MGADFAMSPGLLCGFRRGLFAVGSADLGKRRRWVAFRADSACETAQKLRVGFACVEGACLTCASVPAVPVASIAIAESRALMPRA